jgi:drug/metabolite transporter (DMT)-like permease
VVQVAGVPHADVAVPLALGAAAAFAVANVVQTRAARRVDAPNGLSLRLLVRLVRDPAWLVGMGASVLGFGLQAVALFLAPVVLVQPLIVTELLFALPLAAALNGARLGRREWLGAGLVAAGISCFVLVGQPTGEQAHVGTGTWLLVSLSVIGGVAVLAGFAESTRHRPMVRASALAGAASICFGFLSVLTKVVGHEFRTYRFGALELGQPWLLVVAAITGLLLTQTAFRSAPLPVTLPVIDVGEPLIGSLLGVLVLNEGIGTGWGTVLGVALSGAAIVAGVAVLDTSPMVRAAQESLSAGAGRDPSPARADRVGMSG